MVRVERDWIKKVPSSKGNLSEQEDCVKHEEKTHIRQVSIIEPGIGGNFNAERQGKVSNLEPQQTTAPSVPRRAEDTSAGYINP